MGCWNETCMLSNIPILSGDPVVCYITHENTMTGSIEHSIRDHQVPISFGLRGVYNDYGCISKIKDDPAAKWSFMLLKYLKKHESLVLEDRYGERSEPDTFVEYLKAIERERLAIRKEDTILYLLPESRSIARDAKLNLVFIHEKLHDSFLNEFLNREVYSEDKPFLKAYRKHYSDHVKAVEKEEIFLSDDGWWVRKCFSLYNIQHYKRFYMNHFKKSATELRDLFINFLAFEAGMELSRISWRVPYHGGSQYVEYRGPQIVQEFVSEKINEVLKEHLVEGDPEINPLTEHLFH